MAVDYVVTGEASIKNTRVTNSFRDLDDVGKFRLYLILLFRYIAMRIPMIVFSKNKTLTEEEKDYKEPETKENME